MTIKSKRGGKRPGAGRQQGSKNKTTLARENAIAESGLTPLAYLLTIVRDTNQDQAARVDAAKSAAPYVHPRLAAIEHSGDIGNKPAEKLSNAELDRELAETGEALRAASGTEKAKPGTSKRGSVH